MKPLDTTQALLVLACAAALAGCSSDRPLHLGSDGSFHPDGTAGIADYTGQGEDGQGWAGDSEGEGGPSAELPAANDLKPR